MGGGGGEGMGGERGEREREGISCLGYLRVHTFGLYGEWSFPT